MQVREIDEENSAVRLCLHHLPWGWKVSPRPDNAHRASRLGTNFKLVKIVILSLTNVQNIHVTLAGARTPNVP
ncbi:hypothetical protein CO674_24045 [Rhizobium hidalgonense]|uniref:Uncharacterized protein n=1 Tax=Rhizobium hidalgonense TaxID=1538159 RepID=A0ABX4JQ15_9HYPH|nr:hypothetical protein CO674_24045 [Rhizobium hidalgonense]RWX09622.1 hypothetical protein EHI42_26955 [Rhizobium hidalgonense]